MSFKFNPISGQLDLVTDLPDSVLFNFHLSSLSAYDTIADISYSGAGTRLERIDTVTYSSALYPDRDITKTVTYLDVGKMNQRIDKVEYTGGVFSTQTLTKSFQYTLSGIRYLFIGYDYTLV